MEAGILSIKKIFSQDRRHLVPMFQRPYVWGEQKQWGPFWEDIRSLAERLLKEEEVRAHFLGAIVLDQVAQPTGKVETRLVIDGQQRLTTLQIFLEAFCDMCEERELEKYHKALLKLTRNDDPMSEDEDEDFKVWPTNVDQEHFRRVMRCKTPLELRKEYQKGRYVQSVGHPIGDAYLYFHRTLSAWLDDAGDELELYVDALLNIAREYVRMVVIDLDIDDDAQLIFETLNARGTPLLPTDLVKNFLFHRAQLSGADISKLYERYWRRFDENSDYWRKKIGRGRSQRARIDAFLSHYLTLTMEDEVPAAHLYVTLKDHVATNGRADAVLESLSMYADVYEKMDRLTAGSRDGLFLERITAMDLTTAYPLLMELFTKLDDQPEWRHAILDDLESFLVRRMICGLSTRGYGRLFIDILRAFNKGKKPVLSVREALLSSDSENARWPTDQEFRTSFLNLPLYKTLVRRRLRMVLEALELAQRTKKSEKLALDEKLTVEHIMPQGWQRYWPLSDNGGGAELLEAQRDVKVHTIGNLTLINGKLNPSISNGPWKKKRAALEEHSLLRLNQKVVKHKEWNEDAVEARARQLFNVAKELWSRPA